MSEENDEELMRLRQERMKQMQQQAESNQMMNQAVEQARYQQEMDRQKEMLISIILDADARGRLNTIKLARPEFASNLEMQLIQLYSSGRLAGHIPLSDEQFKSILMQLQNSQQREFKIKFK
jgi:programmed cell death protein 5